MRLPSMPSRPAQVAVAVVLVVLLMAAVTAVTALSGRIPDTGHLLRDPTSVARVPWHVGVVSRFVNLCWAVAATLNVLASVVAPPPLRRLLFLLGLLIAALALDDTLLIHEGILPARGIPEGLVQVAYAGAGLALALLWWPRWRTPIGAAFFAGAGFLALSLVIDAVILNAYVPEDGSKLLGLMAWGFCGAWAFTDAVAQLRRDAVTA